MYTDVFILKDADGNELAHRKLLGHIKEYIDSKDPESLKYPLTINSETSGYLFKVTRDTTSQDWRDFNTDCLMACD